METKILKITINFILLNASNYMWKKKDIEHLVFKKNYIILYASVYLY